MTRCAKFNFAHRRAPKCHLGARGICSGNGSCPSFPPATLAFRGSLLARGDGGISRHWEVLFPRLGDAEFGVARGEFNLVAGEFKAEDTEFKLVDAEFKPWTSGSRPVRRSSNLRWLGSSLSSSRAG